MHNTELISTNDSMMQFVCQYNCTVTLVSLLTECLLTYCTTPKQYHNNFSLNDQFFWSFCKLDRFPKREVLGLVGAGHFMHQMFFSPANTGIKALHQQAEK